jgi:hypothetical protein
MRSAGGKDVVGYLSLRKALGSRQNDKRSVVDRGWARARQSAHAAWQGSKLNTCAAVALMDDDGDYQAGLERPLVPGIRLKPNSLEGLTGRR